MKKRFIIFSIIIMIGFIYSCAKKEPVQSPASDFLANKISESFQDLNINLEIENAKKLFDNQNEVDFTKIENFSIKQSETGEAGIFKLYSESNVNYIKDIAAKRIISLQEEADYLEKLISANNAEVRSYGNYVYYVSHESKDEIFKIIEDELKGV